MRWSSDALYSRVFADPEVVGAGAGAFALSEHDYCLGDRKFAGNAQSISRLRWVHHTSFLWDYAPANMALLQLPEKRPSYRRDRPHADFLTPLRQHVSSAAASAAGGRQPDGAAVLFPAVLRRLSEMFELQEAPVETALEVQAASRDSCNTVRVDL